jgi:hypothetical protein
MQSMGGDTYSIVDIATILGPIVGAILAIAVPLYVSKRKQAPAIELAFDKWTSRNKFWFSFVYRNRLKEGVTVELVRLDTPNSVTFLGAQMAGATGKHSQVGNVQDQGHVLKLQRQLAANMGDPRAARFQEELKIEMAVKCDASLRWPSANQLTFQIRDRRGTSPRTRSFFASLTVPMKDRPAG